MRLRVDSEIRKQKSKEIEQKIEQKTEIRSADFPPPQLVATRAARRLAAETLPRGLFPREADEREIGRERERGRERQRES